MGVTASVKVGLRMDFIGIPLSEKNVNYTMRIAFEYIFMIYWYKFKIKCKKYMLL